MNHSSSRNRADLNPLYFFYTIFLSDLRITIQEMKTYFFVIMIIRNYFHKNKKHEPYDPCFLFNNIKFIYS